MLTLKGLVIRENKIGESSKSIIVLSEKLGIINVFVRGGAKSKKSISSTQLFSYSILCIDEKKDAHGHTNYYLNSSEPINIFYNSRIENSYFGEILKLTLNTLYFLDKGEKDIELLKSIFEFRLLCEMGFRPYLVGCNRCYVCECDKMHYNFKSGMLEYNS